MTAKKSTPTVTKTTKKQAKKVAPKKQAKKAAPKKHVAEAKSKTKNGALLEAAREVLPRLQAGGTTLSAERDRLGLSSNGPLRKALTELLGGKQAYQKMMAGRQQGSKKKASA